MSMGTSAVNARGLLRLLPLRLLPLRLLPLLLIVVGSPADAAPTPSGGPALAARWDDEIERKEFFTLRDEVERARDVPDREYFLGLVACRFNRLTDARTHFTKFLAGRSSPRTRRARECLAEVEKRSENYAEAAGQLERVLRDFGAHLTAEERFDDSSSARYLRELGRFPAMRRAPASPDTIAITKDSTGIAGGVRVNDHLVPFGFDSGANFSICGDSTATMLGLRTAVRNVPLGTINDRGLTAEFRIADSLEVGGAKFLDVPFLVIPQSMMRISGGIGLVGFPVALGARRLVLRYGPRMSGPGSTPAPLAIDGLNPVTLGTCAGIDLVMTIDTGASRTLLYPAFYRRARDLGVKFGASEAVTSTGLGGASTFTVRRLEGASLKVGGFVAHLDRVTTWVTPRSDASRVFGGNLGNDVFRPMGTVVFDFEKMTFGAL